MGSITFNRQSGGLGRPLNGKDYYSAQLFYSDTLPSGFAADDRIKQIFSLQDAENLGILNDFSDETKGTGGTVQITLTGATGDVAKITLQGGVLATYTLVAADAVADIATGLAAYVNANTVDTGWSAVAATDTVTLTQPTGLGVTNNTTSLAFSTDGAATAVVTQFTGGLGSELAYMHYQISEFFRMQPKGYLWVGVYAQGTYEGTEIKTMQDFAEGEIRQIAVHIPNEVFASSHVTATQAILDTLESENKPLSAILGVDFTGLSLATLSDLSTLDSERVSVSAGTDGNYNIAVYSNTKSYVIGEKVSYQGSTYVNKKAGLGFYPYNTSYWTNITTNLPTRLGYTVSVVGNILGTVALASVHENIGWVAKFNLTSGNILDEAGLVTGEILKDLSESAKTVLENKKYIFLVKYLGYTGSFHNDSYTATLSSSDFATIENVRTMDKAVRQVRIFELPELLSPLYVNKDGTLRIDAIARFENAADRALRPMLTAGELSEFSKTVNPDQNVLGTSKVVVSIALIPVGVARQIENNIGFETSNVTT